MQIQNIDENLSMNISDTSGVSLQVSDVDTSLEMNIATNDVINLNIINEEGNISMEVETSGSKIEGTTDHSKLQNLDYEHSGHTGFASKEDIPDVSKFITNTVDNLVNYYKKNETFNKSEIEQFSSEIMEQLDDKASKKEIPSLNGYATEEWVEDKDYITIPDFQQIMDTFYYDKQDIDTLLEDLPSSGSELTGGDNTVIEDNKINVYTNTGYKVSDKDVQIQSIIDSATTGENKIVYAEDIEIMFIIDGTNKLRKSENGIDFEVIMLPRICKDLLYMPDGKRLLGLSDNGYLIYSDDLGKTWNEQYTSLANGGSYIFKNLDYGRGFSVIHTSTKRIVNLNENFTQNSGIITSAIVPTFMTKLNATQYIWCDNNGTFKYGAGSQEGEFVSLSNATVNMLKNVNLKVTVGLENSDKFYVAKSTTVNNNEWLEYSLPDVCTINDIIFNPNDETYYIFTDINTYYKTKDFVNYDSVEKNSLRGIQGYFTSMGIQMTTSNHNELLLAPTRTKLENKAQEWDRGLNKSLWVGNGLELTEEGKVNVKSNTDIIGVSNQGLYFGFVDEYHLTEDVVETLHVAKAQFEPINPDEFIDWYWNIAVPWEGQYKATKVVFKQAGSFFDQVTWETEYFVEQYEYGYIYCDANMSLFKYVKLGNLSWFFE